MRLRRIAACAALCVGPLLWAEPLTRTEQVLWTTCTITVNDHGSESVLDSCFERLREIQARMGTDVAGSEVEAINAAAGRRPVHVTDDLLLVVEKALSIASLSGGLFDLTVGPLIEAWKMNRDSPDIPSREQIAAALRLINWRDVVVDRTTRTVFLRRAGMRLDLGGFIKGYAADEMQRILSHAGVQSALIDLGGNIFAMGSSPRGTPWRIGIQSPDEGRGAFLGVVEVTNASVTTAGVYEHAFVKRGKRYHHIMDVRTGYPVENGLVSVTVIGPSSTDCDAFDTALLTMGKADGLKLAEEVGLNVVMVDSLDHVYATAGARRILTLTDPRYSFGN